MLSLGAEPSIFLWTVDAPKRKPPSNREPTPTSSKKIEAAKIEEEFHTEVGSICDGQAPLESETTSPVTTPVDPEIGTVQSLLERIELLERQNLCSEEKIAQLEKEKRVLLDRQFSLDKIKDDDSAILFYTGFPN